MIYRISRGNNKPIYVDLRKISHIFGSRIYMDSGADFFVEEDLIEGVVQAWSTAGC